MHTTTRRARKPHRCYACLGPIRPGDRYLRHVAFPGHPDAYPWSVLAECAPCAARYARPID